MHFFAFTVAELNDSVPASMAHNPFGIYLDLWPALPPLVSFQWPRDHVWHFFAAQAVSGGVHFPPRHGPLEATPQGFKVWQWGDAWLCKKLYMVFFVPLNHLEQLKTISILSWIIRNLMPQRIPDDPNSREVKETVPSVTIRNKRTQPTSLQNPTHFSLNPKTEQMAFPKPLWDLWHF